ncbi:MAG TPA: type II secretion system F family protein [Phycisphaerae bacterium]|nr:type II secretion system F family protein [Phycisphaerae bacterium]
MISQLMLAQSPGMMDQVMVIVLPLIGSIMLSFAIFSLVRDLRKPDSRRVQDRLREKSGFDGGTDASTEKLVKASILRTKREAESLIGQALSKLSVIGALQRMLDQANLNLGASSVLMYLTGLSAISYIAGYFLKLELWLTISLAVGAFLLPLIVVFIMRKIRLNKFLNQLPDVFELMSQALRAGHSLPNAILVISQQLHDPVRSEFARVFHEQNLGIKIEDSLKNMAKRIGMMDVNFFVTAVCIQRQTGGDLAEVLDNISGVIRERIKLFGMVKALTAEGRLSGWVLLALPIVVFVLEMVVNPAYADKLLDTQIGNYMLITGAVMQLLGLAMIQKIVNIKV